MIIINDMMFQTKENINDLITQMKENAYKEDLVKVTEIYHEFLIECYEADERLQQMVFENISEDYLSCTVIPINDTDDLNSFGFSLVAEDDRKIKKREELKYKDLCNICFGHIQPYYSRLVEHYQKP